MWCADRDADLRGTKRMRENADDQYLQGVIVDGRCNNVITEGGDIRMQRQIMEYLASHVVARARRWTQMQRVCTHRRTLHACIRTRRAPRSARRTSHSTCPFCSGEHPDRGEEGGRVSHALCRANTRRTLFIYPNYQVVNANGVASAAVELCVLTGLAFSSRGGRRTSTAKTPSPTPRRRTRSATRTSTGRRGASTPSAPGRTRPTRRPSGTAGRPARHVVTETSSPQI